MWQRAVQLWLVANKNCLRLVTVTFSAMVFVSIFNKESVFSNANLQFSHIIYSIQTYYVQECLYLKTLLCSKALENIAINDGLCSLALFPILGLWTYLIGFLKPCLLCA